MKATHASLRRVALGAAVIGAAGSLALMLHAGRRQQSRTLILLFAIWVLSPFAGAVLADTFSRTGRPLLYVATLFITVGSLLVYGFSTMKAGTVFLLVPLASWLLIAAAVAVNSRGRGNV